MNVYEVKVYQVPKLNKPGVRPTLIDPVVIKASTVDGARAEAAAKLADLGYQVRSINFTADGGMTAMVYTA